MPYSDPEKRRQHQREYYQKNKEKVQAWTQKWEDTHPEGRKEISRRYRELHRDEIREKSRSIYGRKAREALTLKSKHLRRQALDRLGGLCTICKSTPPKRLEIHHLWYDDKERKYALKRYTYWRRVLVYQDVLEHPEKYALLCRPCHRTVSLFVRDPNAMERTLSITKATRDSLIRSARPL